MKKILFLTTQFPFPLDNGGKIGAFNGLDILSDNDIYLLSFSEQMNCVELGKKNLCSKWKNLHIVDVIEHDVHIKKKYLKLGKTILKSYFGPLPYLVEKFEDEKMYKAIDSIFKENVFDIIFVDYLNMYNYGQYISRKYKDKYYKLVFKNHNIEYEIFRQTSKKFGVVKRVLTTPIWKKTKKYEEYALKKADIVFSVCEPNTEYFKKYNKNSYTMKPTFDIINNEKKQVINHNLLYIGNLSWGANLEGIKWFVEKVLPIVREKIEDVKLTIIGSGNINNPFKDNDAVIWRGYVEDLNEVYDSYKVFIVPLFEGSGIRIKILEAFNHNIPVVSTTLACETIGVKDMNSILIADTSCDFANAVLMLLQNEELCENVVRNAKELLTQNYSLESRKKEINSILN